MDQNQPILIAGAGPTGLCLAITLRRYGIPVRIVDRAAAPSTVSKALALWSGSLEALAAMGLAERFVTAGRRLNKLSVGDGARQLATLAVGDGIDSPYPFPLLLPQSRTERFLGERLAELGVTVERGLELADLRQDLEGVSATLKSADGAFEEVRTPYLVGCDGARSFVRQHLGIDFEGYTEPANYLLGDVQISGGDLDHRSIYVWWHKGGTVALFPYEDMVWRIFAQRDADGGDATPALDELQDHIDRHGPGGLTLSNPTWLSMFRVNERLAARYRVGRCFIAGDAAHIHSPAGGQGMNTGIQDAANLGWKLAYVMQGIGEPEVLLDSYEAERRPIAHDVVKGAAQKLHVAFSGAPLATLARDMAVAIFGNIPAVQKKLQVELSETEIVYRDGPLVRLGRPPRRAGRTEVGARARDALMVDGAAGQSMALWPQLCGISHTLLVFEDAPGSLTLPESVGAAGERLRVLRLNRLTDPQRHVRERYHVGKPGWVLVRPDQVVAARGQAGDYASLDDYVREVLSAWWRRAAAQPAVPVPG